jgi:hypothetical protein
LDDHPLPFDQVAPVDLRFSSLGHDVHSGVLHHFRTVFTNLGIRVYPKEFAVRLVEVSHKAFGIRDHSPVVNTVENELIDLDLALQFLRRRRLVFFKLWNSVQDAPPGLNGNVDVLIRSYFSQKGRASKLIFLTIKGGCGQFSNSWEGSRL